MLRIDYLLYFCIFISIASACLSSGCGGGCGCGGCNSYQAPAPANCAPPCPTGYTCGPYGCARTRVFSSVNYKILLNSEIFNTSEPLRNMFGITRNRTNGGKSFTPYDKNVSSTKFDNPNDIFRECCEDRLLPDSCLGKCSFNSYTRDALQRMFLNNDACPLSAAADMQFCAAQGKDHTDCCLDSNVHTTLAGQKCLIFCDQRPGMITKLDYSFLPCYERFEEIKQCMYRGLKGGSERQAKTREELL